MKKWKTKEKNNEIFYFIFAAFRFESSSSNRVSETTLPQKLEFTFNEYLGYVKKFHPLVKTANLEINKAQASLMAERRSIQN
jgi:hypothetical protein